MFLYGKILLEIDSNSDFFFWKVFKTALSLKAMVNVKYPLQVGWGEIMKHFQIFVIRKRFPRCSWHKDQIGSTVFFKFLISTSKVYTRQEVEIQFQIYVSAF